jgi:hypothetical protein
MTALEQKPKDAAAVEPEVQKLPQADPLRPGPDGPGLDQVQKGDSKRPLALMAKSCNASDFCSLRKKRLAVCI